MEIEEVEQAFDSALSSEFGSPEAWIMKHSDRFKQKRRRGEDSTDTGELPTMLRSAPIN